MKHLKKIPLCPKKIRVTLFLLLLSCLIIGCVHWKNQNVENQINHHTQEIADLADSIDLITRTGAPRLITQNGTTYNPNNLPDNVTINQDGVVLDWNNPCDNCYRMSWGEVIYDPWKNMTTSEILNSLITIEGEEVVISSEKPRLTIPLNENVYSDAFKNAYRMYPEIPSGILEAIVFSETQFRNLHSELDSYPESLATDGDHGTPGYTARYTIFNLAKDDYMIGHEGLRYLSSLSGYDVEELIANPNKVILAYAQGLILSASNRNMSLSSFDDLSYLITDIATGGRYPLSTLITMPYNMRKVAIALQYEPVRQFYGLERIQFELDDFTLNTFPKKLDSWGYLRYANPLTSTFLDAESRLYVVNDYRISNGLSAITLEQMLEIEAENKWSPPPGVRLKQLNTTSDGSGGNQTFSVNNSKCEKAYDTNDPRPMYPQPTFLGPPLPPAVFGVNECYWPDVAASAGVIPNWTSAVLPSGHGVCNNLCGASSLGNEHEQKVIAIHGMQGSMSGSLTSNVKNCSAAAHYYISQNGIIIQAIHENRKGAHAGVANPNNIGIEHEKSNPQFEKPCLQKNSLDQCIQWGSCIEYDDKSYSDMDSTIYRASARLVVSIASRHPDIDVSDIFLGNPEYTSSIPPGCFGGSLWPSTLAQDQCVDIKGHHHFGISKTCPGANWDWYTYFNHLAAVQQVGHSGPTQPYTANSGSFNLNSVGSNYWAVHTIDNNQMFGELDLFNASFEKNDQIWLWGNPYKKGNPIYVGHRPVGSYVNSTWYAQDQAMFSNLYSVWGGFSVEVRTDCNAPAASFGVTWASGNVVNTLVDDPVDFGGNNSWNSAKSLDAGRTTSPNGNNLNLSQYNTVGSGDPDRNKNWKYDRPRGYGLHERHFGYAFGGDSMITRTIAGDLSSASDQNWYVVEFPNGSVNGIELTEDTIQFRLLKAAGTGDPVKLTVYKNTSTTNMAPLTTQPVAELFSGEAFMRKISKADNILRLYLKVEAGPDYASNGQFVFGAGWMYPNNDLDGYVLKCYDAFEGLSGNNNAANAHPFPTLTNNTFQSVTIDGCLDYVASDEDWYYVPIANAGMLTASLFGQENDFNIELVNAAGLVTSSSINGSTIGEYLTYCGSGGLSCEGVFVRIWPQSSSFPSGGKGYTLVLFWDGSVTCSPSGNIGTSNNQIFSSSFVPINVSANTTTSCPGGQVTLTATGGSTYDWYDDQGSTICTNCPGIQTVTIPTGVSAVTYTVSESGSLCAPESITINVTGGPTALAGADQTSPSSGSTVSLNGNASGGTPGYSYQWTWNGGNVSGQNVSVSPLLTTQYTLTVTDANGCQGADDVKIEVPVPTTTCISNAYDEPSTALVINPGSPASNIPGTVDLDCATQTTSPAMPQSCPTSGTKDVWVKGDVTIGGQYTVTVSGSSLSNVGMALYLGTSPTASTYLSCNAAVGNQLSSGIYLNAGDRIWVRVWGDASSTAILQVAAVTQVTATSQPDLVMNGAGTLGIIPGVTSQFLVVNTTNAGNAPATGSLTEVWFAPSTYAYTPGFFDLSQSYKVASSSIAPLNVSGLNSFVINYSDLIGLNLPVGLYSIHMKADAGDQVAESDEANWKVLQNVNGPHLVTVASQGVSNNPDLTVTNVNLQKGAYAPGEIVNLDFTIDNHANGGNQTQSPLVHVYYSANSVAGPNPATDILLASTSVVNIWPNTSKVGSVSFSLPSMNQLSAVGITSIAGVTNVGYFWVVVDPNNTINESPHDFNNAKEQIFTIVSSPQLPNLVAQQVDISGPSGPLTPGEQEWVTWLLKNTGTGDALSTSTTKLYIGDQPTVAGTQQLLGSWNQNAVTANSAGDPGGVNFTVPCDVTAGQIFYLRVVTDADNDVVESNENDNTVYLQFSIIPTFVAVQPQFTSGPSSTCVGVSETYAVTHYVFNNTFVTMWDFGDGFTITAPTNNYSVPHIYTQPGTYTVTATVFEANCNPLPNNGVSVSKTVVVGASSAGLVNITNVSSDLVCAGSTVNMAASTQTGVNYLWDFGDGGFATAANVSHVYANPGVYTATLLVNDQSGCSANLLDTVITVTSGFTLNTNTTDASSPTSFDGSASVNPVGGVSPFTYLWSNGGTTNQISNVGAGTYTVTVTDDAGCVSSENVTVNAAPTCNLTITSTSTSTSSPTASDGSANVTVTGGTAPYTYGWNNGAGNTNQISNVVAGTYTVTVTDISGCVATEAITISPGCALTISSTSTPTSTSTSLDGSATVNVSGGTAPYSYGWSVPGATTNQITGVAAGTYLVVVSDAVGCVATETIIINAGCALPIPDINTSLPLNRCVSLWDTLYTTTTASNYLWKFGDGGAGQTSSFAFKYYANPGTYTIKLTATNSCGSATDSITVNVVDNNLAVIGNVQSASTSTASDASVNVSVSGGQSPYSFAWSNGSTNQNATGLSVGTYTLEVTDAVGCSLTEWFDIEAVKLPVEWTGITAIPLNKVDAEVTLIGNFQLEQEETVELERSRDGDTWEKVNSSTFVAEIGEREIRFIDQNAALDTTYAIYRGKGIDLNGEFTYTNMAEVHWDGGNSFSILHVFPNPANDLVTVRFEADEEREVEIVVYNAAGQKIVRLERGDLKQGIHEEILQTESWAEGVYMLSMSDKKNNHFRRFVVKH